MVKVSVVVVAGAAAFAAMVAVAELTVQMLVSLDAKFTVTAVDPFEVAKPFASRSVAVALLAAEAAPAGNEVWASERPRPVAAPGPVKVTVVWHPVRPGNDGDDAES